jgi:hypothetical protein
MKTVDKIKKSDNDIALFNLVTHIAFRISGILNCKISGNLRDFSWVTNNATFILSG